MVTRRNPLLPVLAAVVVLMAVFVWVRAGSDAGASDATRTAEVTSPDVADADTPADTIRTLTANVAEMNAELEALRQENRALRQTNDELGASQRQREEQLAQRLRAELADQADDALAREQGESRVVEGLAARVEALSEAVGRLSVAGGASDIPVGLGLDDLAGKMPATASGLVWVEPLDQDGADGAAAGLLPTSSGGVRDKRPTASAGGLPLAEPEATEPRPYYTINDQATLTNATAFTALIGRVPIAGQVRDPMPIKVLTGADNLAANGLEIPEVAGAVWGGRAIGDWTLGCVRGDLDVVTFIFEDGTIVTHREEGGEPIAYLSDAFGNPCVAGKRVTNAAEYLGSRVALATAAAAAEAAAASESTNVVSGAVGTTTSSVTGDRGRYVLGKSVSSGVDEVSRWLDARMQDSFDAVYVPPGRIVTVNVSQELPIDYDPKARRLRHAGQHDPHRRPALD